MADTENKANLAILGIVGIVGVFAVISIFVNEKSTGVVISSDFVNYEQGSLDGMTGNSVFGRFGRWLGIIGNKNPSASKPRPAPSSTVQPRKPSTGSYDDPCWFEDKAVNYALDKYLKTTTSTFKAMYQKEYAEATRKLFACRERYKGR